MIILALNSMEWTPLHTNRLSLVTKQNQNDFLSYLKSKSTFPIPGDACNFPLPTYLFKTPLAIQKNMTDPFALHPWKRFLSLSLDYFPSRAASASRVSSQVLWCG